MADLNTKPEKHDNGRASSPDVSDFSDDEWTLIEAAIEYINDKESGSKTPADVETWLNKWFSITEAMEGGVEVEIDRTRVLGAVLQYLNSVEM